MNESVVLHRLFWKAWLSHPREVGALLPSGRNLAEAMAMEVDPGAKRLIEVGAGTGAVTRALLARGFAPEQLVLVEKSPALAAGLARRFPNVQVLQGDATRLRRLIERHGVGQPATIVSSLPLLSLSCRQRLRVLIEIAANLPVGGRLVQFTYSPRAPIKTMLADSLGLEGARARRIAMNLPPAVVWVYTRQQRGSQDDRELALAAV
jgi:phosphatidylethanolamine/phosphatidyl-N-methylethanolamine N-methyltransferase